MTQGLDDGVELKSGGGEDAERSVKPRVLNPWEAQASGPLSWIVSGYHILNYHMDIRRDGSV